MILSILPLLKSFFDELIDRLLLRATISWIASKIVEVSAESNSTYPVVAWKNSMVMSPRRAETAQIEASHASSNHAAKSRTR